VLQNWVDVIATGEGALAPAAPALAATATADGERHLRAMLFGDVKGFSKLREAELPLFVGHVLGSVGAVLTRFGDRLGYANTWGDGIFSVLDDSEVAARCALALQAEIEALDLPALGLPDTLALRLGGHYGPVYEMDDPIQHRHNLFGAQESRTARIEPVMPPCEVYVTEPFAARLAFAAEGLAFDYVGEVPAAKGWGSMRMYHLNPGA